MFQLINSDAPTVTKPTNHVMVVDVSGSMHLTLQQLRTDLKNKITALIKPGDLLTIIYFSGSGTAGYVFEHKSISSATDLTDVKTGIDRYLVPMGLTAFCKPLKLAVDAIRPDMFNSLLFLTDGYNNDCSTKDVFTALDAIRDKFDGAYFIEYGYYVDSKLISQMAEHTSGTSLTAEGFNELTLSIESGLRGVLAPKIEIDLDAPWAVGFNGENLTLYRTSADGKIYVPGDTKWIAYGDNTGDTDVKFAMAWGYFVTGDIDQCEAALIDIGDVGIIKSFTFAYGKQKMNAFKQLVLDTVVGDRLLYADGVDRHYVIDPNAFTVMEMLNALTNGENVIYLNHPAFSYKRISAKREQATGADPELLTELASVVGDETASDVLGTPKLLFEATDKYAGVPFKTISFNSERANINFTVTTPGRVTGIPTNEWGITEWPSKIVRSYNIVKDGILNVTSLPVKLDVATADILYRNGVEIVLGAEYADWAGDKDIQIINFGHLPVINRRMLSVLNSVDTAMAYIGLEEQKAAAKVFKYMKADLEAEMPKDTEELRNEWLSNLGIRDYGFNPPTTKAESTDVYFAPKLEAKIKGLSSLPSVSASVTKRELGKTLNLGDQMILKYVDLYTGITDNVLPEKIAEVTKTITEKAIENKRKLEYEISKVVMSIVLGRRWFSDKADYDDNVVTVDHPEWGSVTVTFDYKDIEVKI